MLEKVFYQENVKTLLSDAVTQSRLISKEIPNTICGEKITQEQYCLYIVIDAIIKYCIIINEEAKFNDYLDQIKRIIKRLQTHNDIVMAINKLLIKTVKSKLGIKEITQENKKEIITYFYDRYIKEGYLCHSFYEYFYEKDKGLNIEKYNQQNEKIKKVQEILERNKLENSYYINTDKELKLEFTDSLFMAAFYAYNSPSFLYKLGVKLIRQNTKKHTLNNSFFFREYHTCINNLDSFFKKKDIHYADKNRLIDIFKEEWKTLNVSQGNVMIAFVKRKELNKNLLDDYQSILNSKDSLEEIVHNILNNKYCDCREKLTNMPNLYVTLPSISDLINKEQDQEEMNKDENFNIDNNYGSATILAIIGVLLIALGIFLTIMMMGR